MEALHHLFRPLLSWLGTQPNESPFIHACREAGALMIYVICGRLIIRRCKGHWREILFAVLNIAALYKFVLRDNASVENKTFAIYLGIVCFQYLMLRAFADKKGWLPWLAFFTPIAALIVVRYTPVHAFALVGISYLAFRTSRLVLEGRNGLVKKPKFCEYLNFSFFMPTMPVGPINTYANYRKGFEAAPWDVPIGRGLMRILIGLVKYQFLGGLCSQLDYASLLLDDHPHPWMDLPVAMVFYYLFLYCNFSGFCDIAIGAAALIGIPVPENFDNPFAARNMREFWNRWHITLSQWMRDVVFAPLSKYLVGLFGPANVNHAVALTVAIVFFLIGIWHGVGWNYALFGLAQSVGVVTVHYYTIFLKKRLGRDGFKAYNENRWIRAAAVTVTFFYYAATLFFFANTIPRMKQIFSILG